MRGAACGLDLPVGDLADAALGYGGGCGVGCCGGGGGAVDGGDEAEEREGDGGGGELHLICLDWDWRGWRSGIGFRGDLP